MIWDYLQDEQVVEAISKWFLLIFDTIAQAVPTMNTVVLHYKHTLGLFQDLLFPYTPPKLEIVTIWITKYESLKSFKSFLSDKPGHANLA